jgi:hypothetical protein
LFIFTSKPNIPLYLLEAEIIQDGEIKATAKGKFYDQPDLVHVLGPFS